MFTSVILAATTLVVAASGTSWLDAATPSSKWVVAGAPIAAAPHEKLPDLPNPCVPRPPSTPQDRAVTAAGWHLVGANQQYGRTQLIFGAATFDGMCRAVDYQGFVFFDGKLVGTLSPTLMNSRDDGSANYYTGASFFIETEFDVTYARYSDADPSCCPHGITTVTFRTTGGKLTIESASTSKPGK